MASTHRVGEGNSFSRRRSMRRPRPGLVSRDSGGSGTPPGRHYDRSARSSLDRDRHKARLVPESAAPIEPKVAARGAPGGAFLLTKEEGDASQASHRAASPAAHREPHTLPRLPALRSPRGGAGIWNRTRACPGPTKEHGRRSVGLPAAARRPGYLEFKLEMSALNLSRHPEERGGEVAEVPSRKWLELSVA